MTHRKTHLWISLVAGVVAWGAYFTHFVQSVRSGDLDGLVFWFVGALAVVLVAETVVAGAVAWLLRKRARTLDEGPTLNAALKAGHVALMLLVGMLLAAAGVMAFAAGLGVDLGLAGPRGQVVLANGLLALVVIAELARAGLTLALMPRG